jgi:hypothetical protein
MMCRWCDKEHGSLCPEGKAVEYYYEDGTVKRVDFVTLAGVALVALLWWLV